MTRYSGHLGGVYAQSLLVEDCEDAWNEQVIANVTATLDNSVYKVGAGSAKFAVAELFNGGLIGTEAIASADLSAYKSIYAWVRSGSKAQAAGAVSVVLDDTALCASVLKTLALPSLPLNTWRRVNLPLGDASGLTAIISVGLTGTPDDACDLNIDDVRALKLLAGIRRWTLDQNYQVHSGKGFDDAGVPNKTPGGYEWSGTFEGFKAGAPLTIGSKVVLALGETLSVSQQWIGEAIINRVTPVTDVNELVAYSYEFEGASDLELPTL